MHKTLVTTRGTATLHPIPIPLLIDGVRTTNYDFYMDMPAFEIETVRFLQPWETIAYTYGGMHGAVLIKTRNYKEPEPLPSKGAMYSPTGLSPLSHPYKEMASPVMKCDKPGNYRLIVDVITDSDIQSYEHFFKVVE